MKKSLPSLNPWRRRERRKKCRRVGAQLKALGTEKKKRGNFEEGEHKPQQRRRKKELSPLGERRDSTLIVGLSQGGGKEKGGGVSKKNLPRRRHLWGREKKARSLYSRSSGRKEKKESEWV